MHFFYPRAFQHLPQRRYRLDKTLWAVSSMHRIFGFEVRFQRQKAAKTRIHRIAQYHFKTAVSVAGRNDRARCGQRIFYMKVVRAIF